MFFLKISHNSNFRKSLYYYVRSDEPSSQIFFQRGRFSGCANLNDRFLTNRSVSKKFFILNLMLNISNALKFKMLLSIIALMPIASWEVGGQNRTGRFCDCTGDYVQKLKHSGGDIYSS